MSQIYTGKLAQALEEKYVGWVAKVTHYPLIAQPIERVMVQLSRASETQGRTVDIAHKLLEESDELTLHVELLRDFITKFDKVVK